MARLHALRIGPVMTAFLAVLALWAAPPSATAQRIIHPRDTNYLDQYGNARPLQRDPLWFAFENDAQRTIWQGYQSTRFSGHPARLAQLNTSLPGAGQNFLAETALGRFLPNRRPQTYGITSRLLTPIEAADRYYGGFDEHLAGQRQQPIGYVLRRRPSMLSTIGLRAPLLRAMEDAKGRPTARASIQQTPFIPSGIDDTIDPTVSLAEKMADRIGILHRRARAEAWTLFEAGEYRLAARAFNSATTLVPNDFEARVGEMFSALSTGSIRTALVILDGVRKREINPFVHQLNVASRYDSPQSVRALRTGLQRLVQQSEGRSDILAIQVFSTWYLGLREEAATIAVSLAGSDPDSGYARWPELMSEAQTALESVEQHSGP